MTTKSDRFQQALALHQAGQVGAAQSLYEEVVRSEPLHADAINLLGTIALQTGDSRRALDLFGRAVELDAGNVGARCNRALTWWQTGELEAALGEYDQAIALKSDLAEAHFNRGQILSELNRFEAALASYRHAIELDDEYAEAYERCGALQCGLQRWEAALADYDRAIALIPDFELAHSNRGIVLRELGQLQAARASFERAIEIAPAYADAHNNLGTALLDLDRPEEAVASLRQALQLKPEYVEALNNLAVAFRRLGQNREAVASCEQALRTDANSARSLSMLGELRADQGDFAAAEQLYQRAMRLEPDVPEAWSELPRLRRMTRADTAWLSGAQRLASHNLPPRKQAGLRFALGKYFDDLEQFEEAFAHYRQGNELLKRFGPSYEPGRQTRAIDELIRLVDQRWLQQPAIEPPGSERAVFVVGMPRSGTTLAEQILASHPDVFGAGELSFWPRAAASFTVRAQHTSRAELLGELGREYLQQLYGLSSDASRVIDKMPGNFQFLGLIHAALPQARLIHMQRSPLDTCLSIYFQNFSVVHPYAQDLEDLAHFYAEYQRILQHWRESLPAGVLLEVPYEGLVEDPELWSRRMIEFIGLNWDPRCLEFHQTARSVTTASLWQVRQKISKGSVERWRRYEPYLAPLMPLVR